MSQEDSNQNSYKNQIANDRRYLENRSNQQMKPENINEIRRLHEEKELAQFEGATSNQLFETLADWNRALQDGLYTDLLNVA